MQEERRIMMINAFAVSRFTLKYFYSSLVVVSVSVLLVFLLDCQAYEIRIGTRPSTLAVLQAEAVAKVLTSCSSSTTTTETQQVKTSILPISAQGDVSQGSSVLPIVQGAPLALLNVDFTGALDDALIQGEINVAVHSAKDIPPTHRWCTRYDSKYDGVFQITCPLPRQDPCDILIGPFTSLQDIPSSFSGSSCKIGTSSIRRQAQLFSILNNHCNNNNNNKDNNNKRDMQVQVVNIRGNLEARLQALERGTVDALILAKSGLNRLHLLDTASDTTTTQKKKYSMTDIPLDQMLPGLCQGIVAAVVVVKMGNNNSSSSEDNDTIFWKENVHAAIALSAERAFLDIVDQASQRPWQGRPPLAGLMRPVSGTINIPSQSASASSSLFEKSSDKNAQQHDVEYEEQDWIFLGLLARPDGTKVLHASMQSPLFSTISSQESDYYSSPQLRQSKDEAARMGKQVGLELLDKAGSHFFVD